MNLKSCSKCKKLFSSVGGSLICRECIKLEEEEFQRVRVYLRENRGADINIVSDETGVPTKKILKYLREGRLEISEGMADILKCEKCGVSIKSGKYCRNCSEKVSKDLSSILIQKEESNNSGAKMHIRRN
ncbi:hypothetical protein [uncultured Tyzzerella sp.]|uniref:hypothetical protein n=1 Tax=uncultured Tyzzerella sp. TaxID=2321398 RepID=UPI002942316C|nr:hypothetical protein [uncultured Tyzzerella sp.]